MWQPETIGGEKGIGVTEGQERSKEPDNTKGKNTWESYSNAGSNRRGEKRKTGKKRGCGHTVPRQTILTLGMNGGEKRRWSAGGKQKRGVDRLEKKVNDQEGGGKHLNGLPNLQVRGIDRKERKG